jgi:hypothetical protein
VNVTGCLWWVRCICCGATISLFGRDGMMVTGDEGIEYPLCMEHYLIHLAKGV